MGTALAAKAIFKVIGVAVLFPMRVIARRWKHKLPPCASPAARKRPRAACCPSALLSEPLDEGPNADPIAGPDLPETVFPTAQLSGRAPRLVRPLPGGRGRGARESGGAAWGGLPRRGVREGRGRGRAT